MAGRGRAGGRSGRGLMDSQEATQPLFQAKPSFKNPFARPGALAPVPDATSINSGFGSPRDGAPASAGRRTLGCCVMLGFSAPMFALKGVQAFAATHAVTQMYSGSEGSDSDRRGAGYVTMAAFGSVVIAS